MLSLAYIPLAFLTHILLRGFTGTAIWCMSREVTGAHILLSLSPPLPQIRAPALATANVLLFASPYNPQLRGFLGLAVLGLICSGAETKFLVRAWPTPKKSPTGTSTLGSSSQSQYIMRTSLRRKSGSGAGGGPVHARVGSGDPNVVDRARALYLGERHHRAGATCSLSSLPPERSARYHDVPTVEAAVAEFHPKLPAAPVAEAGWEIVPGPPRRAAGPRDAGAQGLCLIPGSGSPFGTIHPRSAWKMSSWNQHDGTADTEQTA